MCMIEIETSAILLTSTLHYWFYRFSRTNLSTLNTILSRNLISLLSRPLLKWNILVGSLEGWAGRKALHMTKKSLKLVVLLLRNVYTLTVLGLTISDSVEQ